VTKLAANFKVSLPPTLPARPPLQFSFGGVAGASAGGVGVGVARKALYQKTLTQLRALMIARMAKPEEVRAGQGGGRADAGWMLLPGCSCWAFWAPQKKVADLL
jgi:hypothetical protein